MNANQSIEISSQDIRVVAGERGTLELQGISAEARAMCSAILSSIRCGARLTGIRCIIELVDAEAVVVESSPAGADLDETIADAYCVAAI